MRWISIACVVMFVAGCDPAPPSAPADPAKRIAIVATVYPLSDIARAVGGRRVEVRWWIESGQAVSSYQPSSQQMEEIRRAAVALSGGVGEPYATEQFAERFGDRRLIRLDSFIEPDQRRPLLWLDPKIAKSAADTLAERLAVNDTESAADYRAAATRFGKLADELVSDFDTPLIGLLGKNVASIGNDYTSLAQPFNFTVIQMSDAPAVLLDDDALAAVAKQIVANSAVLLLIEADTPPAVVKNVQARVTVPVVTIDSLGSSSTAGRDTYQKIMRFNYQQLLDGWKRAAGR